MIALDITAEEITSGKMRPEHLEAAVRALREDGFVVLNDVIEVSHLEILRDKMLADVEQILAIEDIPYNFNTGNIQQDPPPFPPYLFRDVLVNDMVVAVTKALLGPGLRNHFYSGNTSLPSKKSQPVHMDHGQLWPNLETAHPAYSLVVNVPVVDMDESNGSTELWPGTHLDTTMHVQQETIKVPEEAVAKRRETTTPLQPRVRCGSVLIRDIRVWHRGMSNRTDTPRPLIAMIHSCSWLACGDPLTFPKGTEELFKNSDLTTYVVFLDGPIDYLNRNKAYDFER